MPAIPESVAASRTTPLSWGGAIRLPTPMPAIAVSVAPSREPPSSVGTPMRLPTGPTGGFFCDGCDEPLQPT